MDSAYAAAGVDFEKEHEVVGVFKKLFDLTKGFTHDLEEKGITPPAEIGYFSDGVNLNLRRLLESFGEEIVLVGGADGAGTKPLAHQLYKNISGKEAKAVALASVGIDAVAMVANDILCGGARPAFIWDYVAWENPNIEIARDLASGLYIGAEQSMATIIGGENASLREMIKGAVPKMGYDISCTGIGFVTNKDNIGRLTGEEIKEGDVVLGLRSSGLHCNGISLSRKSLVHYEPAGWSGAYEPEFVVPELGQTALEEILTPTIIYVRPVLELLERRGINSFDIKGIVNITGEGVLNLHRLLMKGKECGAFIDLTKECLPEPHPVFGLIEKYGNVSRQEMYTDFNMGWGMYIVVPQMQAPFAVNDLQGKGVETHIIGKVVNDKAHTITVSDREGMFSYLPS